MTARVLGLGVETSCDETSVAVVADGATELSNVVYSQVKEHAPFRGVVPEIASRAHLERINAVFAESLARADVRAEDLAYCAVSARPGLVGSLMIGAQLARSLWLVHRTAVLPVDHVEAHFHAVALEGEPVRFPFLGLLLSGGNSAIFLVHGHGRLEKLVDTRDDALGEAFDKASTILGLPYPGGPAVEARASEVPVLPAARRLFPRLLREPDQAFAFSFSGVKTAVLRAARSNSPVSRVCNDFQETVFELVVRILRQAVQRSGLSRIIASGGVLANGRLRELLDAAAAEHGWDLRYPQRRILCTDNAAMVAALGFGLHQAGTRSQPDFAVSSVRVQDTARKDAIGAKR